MNLTLLMCSSEVLVLGFRFVAEFGNLCKRLVPPGLLMGAHTRVMITLRADRCTSAESWKEVADFYAGTGKTVL